MHAMDDDWEDRAALMNRGPSVMGLKVADDEEAATVFRVGAASIGLLAIALLHNIVHVLHKGQSAHSFAHLIMAAVLPVVGIYGVQKRSTVAIYNFHVGNVLFVFGHGVLFVVFVFAMMALSAQDPAVECGASGSGQMSSTTEKCVKELSEAQAYKFQLILWWIFASIPIFGLSLFAAFHSLEFYVQLRLRKLTARVDGSSATVFDRSPADLADDRVE
jgi:hypothetical protein